MGKKGKKKALHSGRVRAPKKSEPNPFEIRINKKHHSVLGAKQKFHKGLPGISRSKALRKRETTLLKEYQDIHKSNNFVDRRIGENDATIDPEEKAVARFAKEWRKTKKSTMFNLNDEELTHLGQSLGDIEDFDDPRSDSEDDENLQGDFVRKAHFGGFMTMKNANLVQPERSHKDIMQELISETKRKRFEKQAEREANTDLTEKLDQDWKTLQSLMVKSKEHVKSEQSSTPDDYDIAVSSLKFEARGTPTDRLKTDDELALEAQKKLENLEKERQKRMVGFMGKSVSKKDHVSADSLDDGFDLDDDTKKSEELEDDQKQNIFNADNESDVESKDDSSDDSYADILSNDSDEEAINSTKKKKLVKKSVSPKTSSTSTAFTIPSSLKELNDIFANRTCQEKIDILEKIINRNHPGLREGNRVKLEMLFSLLLQYLSEVCSDSEADISIVNTLVPILYNLLQFSVTPMSQILLNTITEKRKCLTNSFGRLGNKGFPHLDTLIFLKLVSIFYPTSDFHHPVVTAALLFMSEVLASCSVRSLQDALCGLFICNLSLEYVSYAKRFVPEAITFLQRLLPDSTPKSINDKIISKLLLTTESVGESINSVPISWLIQNAEFPQLSSTKILILHSSIFQLQEFANLYIDLPSFPDIFFPTLKKCCHLKTELLPENVKSNLKHLQEFLEQSRPIKHLSFQSKKPKALKLFTPRVQDVFDGKKQKPVMSAKKAEKQKLLHKYKREFKGAVREIRRDNQFISRQRLNEQLDKDSERKQKLKHLYQDLAQQEGEFKRYKKRRR